MKNTRKMHTTMMGSIRRNAKAKSISRGKNAATEKMTNDVIKPVTRVSSSSGAVVLPSERPFAKSRTAPKTPMPSNTR